MRLKPNNDLRMQRASVPNPVQSADHVRQKQRRSRGDQRRAYRNRSDDRSVNRHTAACKQSQKHCRPADQRRGEDQKRQRSDPRAGSRKKRQRKAEKARYFHPRRSQNREKQQGQQRIDRAEQRNAERRQQPDPDPHPCCRQKVYAAIHQRIVDEDRFDCDLHATSITMTVISSVPPCALASFNSCSPVFGSPKGMSRIACSVPFGSTS